MSRAPAGPRDKRAQERAQSDQRGTSGNQPAERDQWRELPDEPGASGSARQARVEANQSSGKAPGARREPNFGWRPVRAARRSSRTAESGRPPYAEVAFSGIKGGGAFWILQSRRSEHPHGGNCTERHHARTHSERSSLRRALRIYVDLRGYAQGKQGVFKTLTRDGRVY
jgi:hypothetical protein